MNENEINPPTRQDILAEPHKAPWFWRLLGVFGRQTHPVQWDRDHADQAHASEVAQEWWKRQFRIAQTRLERYRIFEEMDGSTLVPSMLDLIAEEVTQIDYEKGKAVWIESPSDQMVKAGEEALRNCMIEDRITPLTRRMCKFGDDFRRNIYRSGKGILGWQFAPADKVHRVEDKYGRLVGFRQDGVNFRAKKRTTSWPWDYIHFRLLGKDEDTGYGTSVLDAMFSPWRQLTLATDAVLMYRMRRAPDRNLILVDVGNMEEAEAMDYVNQFKKSFRKTEYIDPASPQYRKQYNPLTPMEDIFLPMRGDENATRVENLSGSSNSDQIFDLEFFRDQFFGSAKIPKAYMGFEGDINAKATLMQQDVRFARTCKRIRRSLLYGMRQLLDVHYTLLSDGENGGKFDFSKAGQQYLIQMSPISYLDEFERLELVQLRAEIIGATAGFAQVLGIDPKVWATYILMNYAKLPEEVVLKLLRKSEAPEMPQDPEQALNQIQGTPAAESVRRLGLDPRKVKVLMEGFGTSGYYQLNETEKATIDKAVHTSPRLRKIIGDIHEYHLDDLAALQTDASLLPPTSLNEVIEDTVDEKKEVIELNEDLAALTKPKDGPKTITEGK